MEETKERLNDDCATSSPPTYSEAVETGVNVPCSSLGGMEDRSVKVSKLPLDTTEEELELYFSNENNGGGVVKHIVLNAANSTAIIEFLSETVVSNVLEKCRHSLKGRDIHVEGYKSEMEEIKKVVMITDLPSDVSNWLLKLYFEHPQKSGGGQIEKLERFSDGTVLLTFADYTDAARVIALGNHTIKKTKVTVGKWTESPTRTIKVTGFKPSTTEELLGLFFENKDKSGGGKLVSTQITQDGVALITFKDVKVLDVVLSKSHLVDGVKLTVTRHTSCPPKLIDSRKFFIRNINPQTTDNTLDMFMEEHCGKAPKDIVRGEIPGTIMLLFKDEVDVVALQNICLTEKLDDNVLSVEPVPVSSCIQVRGFADNTTDALKYYFASQSRSDGGKINKIQTFKEQGHALVDFKDYKVVGRVLRKEHCLEDRLLSVGTHYDCIGLKYIDGPHYMMRKPVIQPVDPDLIFFFNNSDHNREELLKEMLSGSADLIMPQGNDCSFKVVCTLEKLERNTSKFSSWTTEITKRLNTFLGQYEVQRVKCESDKWQEVKKNLENLLCDEITIRYDKVLSLVVVAGISSKVFKIVKELSSPIVLA